MTRRSFPLISCVLVLALFAGSVTGGPLAQKTGTTSRLMLRDLHGDVVGLMTTTGMVQGSRTFDPYGKPRTSTGESSALGFQGAPTDTDTGLVDMLTRHYAPTLGRFITADQVFGNLLLPVSLNRFSYAGANPVTFSDPDGMCANPEYCPAPTTSSTASANAWYETGATLNEPSYGESSGYTSYVNSVYLARPEIRPPTFRPQFFNRLPRLVGMDKNFRPPEDEGGGFLGFLHTALDVVGFIPVVGEIADGANAALYAVEGDWANAAIYAGAVLIPTSGKLLRAGKELVENGIQTAAKSGDELLGALKRGAPSCNSFTAETKVLMASGRLKPISEIDVGDRVMAADPITHRQGPRRVTDVIVGTGLKELVDVRLANGERITATAGHPFWDERSRSWVDAGDLRTDDRLLKPSERELRLTGGRGYSRQATVYNLTVAGLHTFFAGRSKVLVHNSSCAIPMEEAVERGVQHAGGDAAWSVTDKGNIQFIGKEFTNSAGQSERHIARFDLQGYPDSPHLNLEVQINSRPMPSLDPHTSINPGTIRPGDYGLPP